MKRKIVQQGHNTLMVSLPAKWAQEQGLKKGDELDLEIKGGQILIGGPGQPTYSYKEVSIAGAGEKMGKRIIGALYKAGYDEVKVLFSTPQQFRHIKYVVDLTCLGHEIVEYGPNYCIIKKVAENLDHAFDAMLKQTYTLLIANASDAITAMKENNYEELVNIALRDHAINRFTDYCRRVMNKVPSPVLKNNTTLYHLLEILEKVGDINKDVCNYVAQNQVSVKKDILEIFELLVEYLNTIRSFFYTYSIPTLERIHLDQEKILKRIEHSRKQKHADLELLSYADSMVRSLFDLNGPLLIYHL